MANVVDSLAWDETTVRQRTKLTDADATELEAYFDSAKEAADEYLNNPFVDDDENDLALPARVELGVYLLVQAEYALSIESRTDAMTSVKTHMLAVTYASPEEARMAVQDRYWAPWRLVPGF